MASIKERLEGFVYEVEEAKRQMKGDEFIQGRITSMVPLLIEQMKDMDLSDTPRYKQRRLLSLGTARGMADAGCVKCERCVYLGEDGKFYIEGPRKSMGRTVVDIHPYDINDAIGWGGVDAREIADLLTTYFI
jgi:hypothetical protein